MLCFGGDDVLGDPTAAGADVAEIPSGQGSIWYELHRIDRTIGRHKSAHGLSVAATVVRGSVHSNRGNT